MPWIFAFAVLCVVLDQTPLVADLGYERALVTCLVTSLAALYIGFREREGALASRLFRSITISTLLCITPTIAGLVGWLWREPCDVIFGMYCALAMPVATAVWAASLGVLARRLVGDRRPWRLIPMLIWIGCAAGAFYWYFTAPPIASFTPLLGYFSGNLYDEYLEIPTSIWWARLEQLGWVWGALCLSASTPSIVRQTHRWSRRHSRGRILLGVTLLGVTLLGGAAFLAAKSGDLGYRVRAATIQAALATVETDSFVIHYEVTDETLRNIAWIAADHEFRLAQVEKRLATKMHEKIHSYYFASPESKARWIGARHVEMAKPWRHEIYLAHRAFPHPSLRHELAHVVASEFGDPWFGIAAKTVLGIPIWVSPGLIEGMAVAADWPGDPERTPHETTRALLELSVAPPLDELLGLGFLTFSAGRSYETAGSFVRYLLETREPSAVKRFYQTGGDALEAFGQPLAEIEAQWLAYLRQYASSPTQRDSVADDYRDPGIFRRRCPRKVARLRRESAVSPVSRWQAICRLEPHDWSNESTLATALAAEGRTAEALAIWEAWANQALPIPRAFALIRLAEQAAEHGDWLAARGYLSRLDPSTLDGSDARSAAIMKTIAELKGPVGVALQTAVLTPADRSAWFTFAVTQGSMLARYLRGLALASSDPSMAIDDLRAVLESDLDVSMRRNAARRLAPLAFMATRPTDVRAAIATLQQGTVVDTLLAADWAERLGWTRP